LRHQLVVLILIPTDHRRRNDETMHLSCSVFRCFIYFY